MACLQIAKENDLRSLAFPCISTGRYGFPKEIAAKEVMGMFKDFQLNDLLQIKIIIVCSNTEDYRIYSSLLNELGFR